MCERDHSIYELILSRRTIRQFSQQSLSEETLEKIINAGRLAPSAANLQPLEYIVVRSDEVRKQIFPCLKWASYISPEGDPKSGCEPVAYIVVLVNKTIREKLFEYDVGAAMENMILTAWSERIGSCWLLSCDRDKLREILSVPDRYHIDCVLALGYPAEEPTVEDLKDSPRYWKDSEGRLHVPKRTLVSVVHFDKF